MPNKALLLDQICAGLTQDLNALVRRQRDTQAGATHAENRAEHAKDTRATEQSYLARGLAERVDSMRLDLNTLKRFEPRSFAGNDPVALGAIVEIEEENAEVTEASEIFRGAETSRRTRWWLVPSGGGVRLGEGRTEVRTLTPTSPLGRALLGLKVGDTGSLRSPRGERRFEIIRIE